MALEKRDVYVFANLLEKAGFEEALALLEDEIHPLAQEQEISLLEAAWKYADAGEEQDTSRYQLFQALQDIPVCKLNELRSIHDPL